jgi:hypothetical protein
MTRCGFRMIFGLALWLVLTTRASAADKLTAGYSSISPAEWTRADISQLCLMFNCICWLTNEYFGKFIPLL